MFEIVNERVTDERTSGRMPFQAHAISSPGEPAAQVS